MIFVSSEHYLLCQLRERSIRHDAHATRLASVLVYRRIRRLLPFIICHVAWDVAIPVGFFYDTAYRVMLIAAIVAGIALTLWGGRWQAPSPGRAPG